MHLPPAIAAFWHAYKGSTVNGVDETRFYEVFLFGDNEALGSALAERVLCGNKRATAESVGSYPVEGKRLPAPGDLSVMTDSAGQPRLHGSVVADNAPVLALTHRRGFLFTRSRHDARLVEVELCTQPVPEVDSWPRTWLQVGRGMAS